jgi:hypothetical protein
MKHDSAECCRSASGVKHARELQGSTWNTSRIPMSLCISCSPRSKNSNNIWPRKSWLRSDTFLTHVIWPLTIVSNDEIASYTQFQKVCSKVTPKSRRKTHSINLEGTGPKGTTVAMLSIHPATNAGWKLFGGQLYTHTNQRYITCAYDIAINHSKWLSSNATVVNIYKSGTYIQTEHGHIQNTTETAKWSNYWRTMDNQFWT